MARVGCRELWVACAWLGLCSRPAAAQITMEAGPPELVHHYSTAPGDTRAFCNIGAPYDIPDIPARAFVDAQGYVQLIATHYSGYRSRGDNLKDAVRDCGNGPMHVPGFNADPYVFDDFEWISSPYTLDGTTVYGLTHTEYHGWEHANCNQSDPNQCWWNSVTLLISTNGGSTYQHALTPPFHVVVAPPFAYDPSNSQTPVGAFNPSNIVARGGYYYSLYFVELHTEGSVTQQRGACLMRTANLGDPTAWRGWDGVGFNAMPRGDAHLGPVCTVVTGGDWPMNSSLTWNSYLGRYIGLYGWYTSSDPDFVFSAPLYRLSDDLVSWDAAAPVVSPNFAPTDGAIRWYGSLLQPGDPSRNFEITSRSPYLYYTEIVSGAQTWERNLMRRRIRINKPGDVGRYDVLNLELNERRGLKALDSSFYGNDGQLVGPTWSTERATGPTSLAFDGASGVLVPEQASSLSLTGDFTLEAFVKVTALPTSAFPIIVSKEAGPAQRNFGLYLAPQVGSPPGCLHLSVSVGGNYAGTFSASSVADGNWHHVAATFEEAAGRVRYYIDGTLDVERDFVADPGAALSAAPVGVGTGLTGALDSVRVYNYARSAAEIASDSVGSGNVELCNGQDDDADGASDETFACRLGVVETAACPGGCGTQTRTCEARTCSFGAWTDCPPCSDGDGGDPDGGGPDDGDDGDGDDGSGDGDDGDGDGDDGDGDAGGNSDSDEDSTSSGDDDEGGGDPATGDADAGAGGDDVAPSPDGGATVDAGCGCRGHSPSGLVGLGLVMLAWRRGRRSRPRVVDGASFGSAPAP